MKSMKFVVLALSAVLTTGGLVQAQAESAFAAHHPRRDQVNDRLHMQHQRIHREVREGEMSRAKAMRLRRADRHIRREERHFAARHHGTISPAEQARLNRQENGISRHIGK